ncbi:MAG: hypothetical protein ACI4WX_13925, partial [Aristaeellaceae bacterium]
DGMRKTDIHMEFTPDDVKTHELYVPPKTPVEEMSLEELARGMCFKSQHYIIACMECPAQCCFGRELIRRISKNDNRDE